MSRRNFKKKIYLRADGNSEVGYGHIMRLLALADILTEVGFECAFVCKKPPQFALKEYEVLQIPEEILVADEAAWLRSQLNDYSILVLDGYRFDTDYQYRVKQNPRFLLVVIDDVNAGHFYADMVVNHSSEFLPSQYSVEPGTRLLLGTDYAILRRPFLEYASLPQQVANRRGCFISFGGADPEHLTEKTITACLEAGVERVNVLLPSRLAPGDLEVYDMEGAVVKTFKDQSAADVLTLMTQSRVGICSSSTVAYEACCARMPLITGYYVDNQWGIHQTLADSGCCIALGDFRKIEAETIKKAIEQAQQTPLNDSQERVFHGNSGKNLSHAFLELMEAYH